jgi:serine/threonine protein kinase
MTLSPNARIGPYEVIAVLGAGGMGEVYRARDPRLSRDVAIKVLPAEVAGDPGRLKRFEKEARLVSALNHPNIVTVYEIGSSDSLSYIAMELVEGNTLRELLVGGPLSIKKLLAISTQIADGLAKAHDAGIVHRDLKPENVMVTKDGLVKILDFGLAKLTFAAAGSDEGSQLPTQTGTSPGMVVGTVSYMSPEQASGESVDFRSDQFSFGSVLYEMATGKRAFRGKTAVDTLASILNGEPEPVATVNPRVPTPLRWIVERCLEKEPEARYASTRDLTRDLGRLREGLSDGSELGWTLASPGSRRFSLAWPLLAALSLLVAVELGVILSQRSLQQPPIYRRLTFRRGAVSSSRFAPDGKTIVYGGAWEGRPTQLFSTRVDSTESTPLPLPSAHILSISATGKMAITLRREPPTLAEASLAGGAPREILEDVSDADWAPDGRGLAVARKGRLEFPIGKVLYAAPSGILHDLRFSPDGKSIVFVNSGASTGGDEIGLVDLNGRKTALSRGWSSLVGLAWNPKTGEVWFSARELAGGGYGGLVLHAVSPSGRHRVVARMPGSLLVQDVSREGRVLIAHVDFTRAILALPPGSAKEMDLTWLDFSRSVDLSDDGKAILFDEAGIADGASGAVYIRKTDGSAAVRLGEGTAAALSPDGKWAISIPSKADRLVLLPTGAGEQRVLRTAGMSYAEAKWFPDGKRILFSASAARGGYRLYVQDVFAAGAPRPLTTEGFEIGPVSPNGKLVATRGPDGKVVLYPVDGGEPRPVSVINPDDRVIRWDAIGEALFLATGDVPVRIDRVVLATGRREFWKELGPSDPSGIYRIDAHLTPDGKSYAYTYLREISYLYVVEGMR